MALMSRLVAQTLGPLHALVTMYLLHTKCTRTPLFSWPVHSPRACAWRDERESVCFYHRGIHTSTSMDHPSACRVALILAGGARDVHLTAASLARHLLPAIGGSAANVCLFVRSLLDPDAHKLTALMHAVHPLHLAVLHVDAARPNEQLLAASTAVLRPDQANRSAQELLQVEEAQGWVEAFEKQRGVAFELVVRARLDAFWSAPLPRSALVPGDRTYVVPRAKQFGGLNDRLGLSRSAVAKRVNRRASVLLSSAASRLPDRAGTLNSEQLLNWTLGIHHIVPARIPRLPFCLLVKRKCKCCMSVQRCAHSGNKCRPCSADEENAQRNNASLEVPPRWPTDAAARFDAVVPTRYAAVRRSVEKRDQRACELELGALAASARMKAIISVGEACRLARVSNCAFDASAGKWMGAGCSPLG